MANKKSDNASWLRPIPEDFANDGMSGRKRLILSSITLIVFIGFSVMIWLSYTSESEDLGPIPVVRADTSVIKKKPEEPGGKEIPFQDREVFARVDNLPAEEENVISASAEIPLKRPVAPEELVEEPVEELIEEPAEEVATVAAAAEEVAPAAPPPAPPAQRSTGAYLVQVGAIGDRARADVLWNEVKSKNNAVLANLEADIIRVDLGERGILYRVRGGMIESREAADVICDSLKRNNQGCLVVSR